MKENIKKYKSINIEEVTIGGAKEIKKFYFVKEDSVTKLGKHWASGIGSFNKQHIINHKTKRFNVTEQDIQSVDIQCLTFNQLAAKYSITHIDKLQIDVEGAEYEILDSIDFEKIFIKKILFESKHFDGTFNEGKKLDLIKQKLTMNNYDLKQIDQENILAERK